MTKKTALIILNFNNCLDTRNCIESILKNNTSPVKFVVVDNDSAEEQRAMLSRAMSELFGDKFKWYDNKTSIPDTLPMACVIETGHNLGYAKGNNFGLEYVYLDTDIEYIMILNNDILFVDDIIPGLLKRLNEIQDCAIISPVLYKKGLKEYDINCARLDVSVQSLIKRNFLHYWWRLRHKTFTDANPELFLLNKLNSSGIVEIQLPSGSCMLMNKDYFKSIGSFDPATFLYYEENILYRKIKKTQRRNYLSLDHKCIHLGASTMQSLPSSYFINKASKDSERYYVNAYSDANWIYKKIHALSVRFFLITFKLQKYLSRK